jgi:hypothetical protein
LRIYRWFHTQKKTLHILGQLYGSLIWYWTEVVKICSPNFFKKAFFFKQRIIFHVCNINKWQTQKFDFQRASFSLFIAQRIICFYFLDIIKFLLGAFALDGHCLEITDINNRPNFRPNTESTENNMIDYRQSECYSSHR